MSTAKGKFHALRTIQVSGLFQGSEIGRGDTQAKQKPAMEQIIVLLLLLFPILPAGNGKQMYQAMLAISPGKLITLQIGNPSLKFFNLETKK